MNDELDKKIATKFIKIFGREDYCFCIDSGWFDLFNDTCEKVQTICDLTGLQVVADQVKEKFGSLRFYYHVEEKKKSWIQKTFTLIKNILGMKKKDAIDYTTASAIISDIITFAEIKSSNVCEKCGKYGYVRSRGGWLTCICDKCLGDKKVDEVKEEIDLNESN